LRHNGKRVRQRPNQVKKINQFMRGVSFGEERMWLVEGDIMGNLNAMSNQIPTMISLTLRVITMESTFN
jgi:hypothetical protein